MISMPSESEAARAARCAGWTIPLNYQPVHDCLKELRIGPYKEYGKITFAAFLRQYGFRITGFLIILFSVFLLYMYRVNVKLNISLVKQEKEIAERKQAEQHSKVLLHDMGERNKELTCMYAVSKAIRDCKTIPEILQNVADCIPPSWHYPEITRGKVRFGGDEFVSEPFEETEWKQTSDIIVNGKCCGSIEVYYIEKCPELDEGPFMFEERDLINGMARTVSEGLEHKRVEEESFNAQQRLIDQQQHETERVESELARIRQELVRSTRLAAIGQVSGSIAHDLRNPLGAVRNAAYLLNRRLPKDESKLLDYTEIINHEVAKADQIITNLLEMAGAKVPRKCPVDLGQIIKEIEQTQMSEGVACRISATPDPFVVQADKEQLWQVIDNILSNSVYAMGGQGIIFVEASRDSDYDTIVFRDTGTGFAPKVRDRLFDALVTTKASGIGLGLTICHQIVEKHGGTIEAYEHNQQGAVIRIRLPRS